jgi:hypothetical protein
VKNVTVQLTKYPEPEVDGDDQDVPITGQDAAIGRVSRVPLVGLSVDVQDDGERSLDVACKRRHFWWVSSHDRWTAVCRGGISHGQTSYKRNKGTSIRSLKLM